LNYPLNDGRGRLVSRFAASRGRAQIAKNSGLGRTGTRYAVWGRYGLKDCSLIGVGCTLRRWAAAPRRRG